MTAARDALTRQLASLDPAAANANATHLGLEPVAFANPEGHNQDTEEAEHDDRRRHLLSLTPLGRHALAPPPVCFAGNQSRDERGRFAATGALKSLYEASVHPDVSHEDLARAVDHITGKLSHADLKAAAAQALDYKAGPRDTKAKLVEAIKQRIDTRKGGMTRAHMIPGVPKDDQGFRDAVRKTAEGRSEVTAHLPAAKAHIDAARAAAGLPHAHGTAALPTAPAGPAPTPSPGNVTAGEHAAATRPDDKELYRRAHDESRRAHAERGDRATDRVHDMHAKAAVASRQQIEKHTDAAEHHLAGVEAALGGHAAKADAGKAQWGDVETAQHYGHYLGELLHPDGEGAPAQPAVPTDGDPNRAVHVAVTNAKQHIEGLRSKWKDTRAKANAGKTNYAHAGDVGYHSDMVAALNPKNPANR